MITLFSTIVAFHTRRRSRSCCSWGHSSITAPIVHIPPNRKHSVGG
jgi:hypothetical protein